jgi:hypothetical protein
MKREHKLCFVSNNNKNINTTGVAVCSMEHNDNVSNNNKKSKVICSIRSKKKDKA